MGIRLRVHMGLQVLFSSPIWDFVKGDLMNFFHEFHDRGRFMRSLNSTFLVLISKCKVAKDLKDFKPINLVRSLYKLLVKVLANILKRVANKLVSKVQDAFVER